MTEMDSRASELKRFLPAARALRDDVKKSINMDLPLNGDLALSALKGLIARVSAASDDQFVRGLEESLNSTTYASDKEKITAVLFVGGQLVAYIESELGMHDARQAWHSAASDIASLSEQIAAEVRRTVGEALGRSMR